MKPETISIQEAADRLGISRKTAYKLAREDDFPAKCIRVGSKLRVVVADLDRLLGVAE